MSVLIAGQKCSGENVPLGSLFISVLFACAASGLMQMVILEKSNNAFVAGTVPVFDVDQRFVSRTRVRSTASSRRGRGYDAPVLRRLEHRIVFIT